MTWVVGSVRSVRRDGRALAGPALRASLGPELGWAGVVHAVPEDGSGPPFRAACGEAMIWRFVEWEWPPEHAERYCVVCRERAG